MKKGAFTLAEVLATLSVIGIVAALLIPSVIVNYKNHVFRTAHQTAKTMIADATRNMVTIDSRLNKILNFQKFATLIQQTAFIVAAGLMKQIMQKSHLPHVIKFRQKTARLGLTEMIKCGLQQLQTEWQC